MQNLVKEGTEFTYTAGGTVAAGDVVVQGQMVGVLVRGGGSGDPLTAMRTGVFRLTKKAGLAVTQGDLLYWDASPGEITKTAADGVFIGHADSGAAGGASHVNVFLVSKSPDIAANAATDPGLTYSLSYAAPVSTPFTPLNTADTYTDAAVNAAITAVEDGYEAVETQLVALAGDVAQNAVDIAAIRTALINAGLMA